MYPYCPSFVTVTNVTIVTTVHIKYYWFSLVAQKNIHQAQKSEFGRGTNYFALIVWRKGKV